MDYPGHNAVTDDLSWRTAAQWIGSPVEVIFLLSIALAAAYAISQAIG